VNGWNFPDEAGFRAEERARRRWWAEHFPPDRGQRPPRCAYPWRGDCDRGGIHDCARPKMHPSPCMCYCGERAPEIAAVLPTPLPAAISQEPLWGGAA
jgi:hypothetical protein